MMAGNTLTPIPENTPVPELSTDDTDLGGHGGTLNQPAQALANQLEAIRQFDIPRITALEVVLPGAAAAKIAAEAARDAAQAAGNIYATTSAGIAATNATTNKYFSVPSASTNGYLDLYLNSAGTAVLQKTYPSSALVSSLAAGDFTAESNFKLTQLAPESGYVWSLSDSVGRSVLLVAADGTLSIPKYARDAYIAQSLVTDSGYAWAVTDSQGRVALGITPAGKVVGSITPNSIPGANYLTPTSNIWCIGDSLTAGAYSQVTWREKLAADYPLRMVTNWAVGGQTSTQIAARVGAYVSLLTVSGNQIPASGAVSVTARSISLITSQGSQSLTGCLAGIYGTLTRAGDDSYSFTRSASGTATYCMPSAPFVPDVAGHDFDLPVIFLGRNNLTLPNDIQRDIQACVQFQKAAEKRFLVITPPNGGDLTPGVHTSEGTGSSTLANIKQIESWAVQMYGDRVLCSRPYSWQFNNGSVDDLDDVALETVPRSLRMDAVHWTTAYHAKIGAWVENEINRRGW